MGVYQDFGNSLEASKSLTSMYRELRKRRGLGQKGRLAPGNEDLLWLPRSAVVTAMSALDSYVHEVLYLQIPRVLKRDPIPEPLCNALADLVPIKNGKTFESVYKLISAKNPNVALAGELKKRSLSFASYQTPDKIIHGYALIGFPDIFNDVSAIWPGPATTPSDIKRVLSNYAKRRNQIAHEGDREKNVVRHMQPWYADACSGFIENLVIRLHRTVYPSTTV